MQDPVTSIFFKFFGLHVCYFPIYYRCHEPWGFIAAFCALTKVCIGEMIAVWALIPLLPIEGGPRRNLPTNTELFFEVPFQATSKMSILQCNVVRLSARITTKKHTWTSHRKPHKSTKASQFTSFAVPFFLCKLTVDWQKILSIVFKGYVIGMTADVYRWMYQKSIFATTLYRIVESRTLCVKRGQHIWNWHMSRGHVWTPRDICQANNQSC